MTQCKGCNQPLNFDFPGATYVEICDQCERKAVADWEALASRPEARRAMADEDCKFCQGSGEIYWEAGDSGKLDPCGCVFKNIKQNTNG